MCALSLENNKKLYENCSQNNPEDENKSKEQNNRN